MITYNGIDISSINFYVYIRKSSEDDERQALSPEKQADVVAEIEKKYNLKPKQIVDTITEFCSAKIPNKRPLFNKMVSDIDNGIADGIITWIPSRISRNPVDSGTIIDLMDREKLKVIFTQDKLFEYKVSMDKFWFAFLCIQAKLENDDRGANAKGGMLVKAKMGWLPSTAPLGYKNTPLLKKDYKEIVVDDEKFSQVKRIFTEVLKGRQASEVYKEVSEVWKLTNQHGEVISRSTFYNILNKPFYYGEYEYPKHSGNWYIGLHKPMITRKEFDIVQKVLGKFGKPVAHSHTFDFTGLFRCQVCGCAITASQKTKHYKGTGRIVTYTYYHCTKKNKKIKCNSKPLTEADILSQIDNLLLKITPDQDFVDWSNKWLKVIHQDESLFREEVLSSQQSKLSGIERRLNNLLDMKLEESIDDDIYKQKKENLEKEKNEIKAKISVVSDDLDDWRRKVENTIDFARVCQYKFNNGNREDKQMILMNIGANLILNNDKLLDIKLKPEYEILANKQNWGEQFKDWLEPQKYTDIMEKNSDLRPANPVWLPRVDSDHEPTAYKKS